MKKGLLILFILLTLLSCKSVETKSITVTSSSQESLICDGISFSLRVVDISNTTQEAQKNVNEKINNIIQLLKESGVKNEAITTKNIYFSTAYSYESGRQVKIGQEVSQTLQVNLDDISLFGAIADILAKEIDEINLNNVTFTSSNVKQASARAREKAALQAREKALTLARSLNVELDDVIEIVENDSSTSYYAKAYNEELVMSSSSNIPAAALYVTCNLQVTFSLK